MEPDPGAQGSPGLAAQTVRGGAHLLAVRLVDRALAVVRRLALASLLGPSELGTYAVAALLLTTLDTLTEPGTRIALVRSPSLEWRRRDAGWTLNLGRAIAVAVLMVAFASSASRFFGSPDSAGLVRVIGLSLVLRALESPGMVMLERELRFGRLSVLTAIRATSATAVAIGAALVDPSASAVVLGLLVGDLLATGASYVLAPARPRVVIDRAEWGSLLAFGRWVTVSSVIVFGLTNLDDAVVGRVMGPAMLAQYQLAYLVSNLAATEISTVANRVMLPSLARTRGRAEALRIAFLQAWDLTATAALGVATLTCIAGGDAIVAVLGDEWAPAAGVVWALSLWGALRALGGLTSPALNALGQPRLVTVFHLAMFIPMAASVYPLTDRYGLMGASLSVLAPTVIVFVLRLPAIGRVMGLGSTELLVRLGAPVSGFLVALACGQLVRMSVEPSIFRVLATGSVASVAFAGSTYAIDRATDGSVWSSSLRGLRLLRRGTN